MSKELIEDVSPVNQLMEFTSKIPRLIPEPSLLGIIIEPAGSLTPVVNFTSIVELEDV